ncbi:MAG: heme exporter protein CcmD [Alphaproteobacteria bacterium]|jgi:heme exporter protein D|nr:MAG: heme exporter protein CcmD [Alphaproteobacteria bacterium]
MNLGPYADFIVGAYAAALAIVAALIAWIVLERRYLLRLIEEVERRGITRRSERRGEEKP